MGAVSLNSGTLINTTDIQEETTNEYIVNNGNGTVRVVEHFTGSQTYEDIIKAALRREFAE
jgi:hypothetical protein